MIVNAPAIDINCISKRFTIPRTLRAILRHPFRFQRIQVLDQVTLSVPDGCVMGLLGPNGAGKTTLLRILAATVLPDSGSVKILGQDAIHHPYRVRRQVGFALGDERSFFWRLSAQQNLRFFAALANLDTKQAVRRIGELTALMQLEQELYKPFRELSTGMRQRLAIARALLHDPKVLLIDEPTRGLDPGAAQRARSLVRQTLSGQLNKTVLLATHNLEEARQVSDRLAVLKNGQLIMEGKAQQILERVPRVFELEEA